MVKRATAEGLVVQYLTVGEEVQRRLPSCPGYLVPPDEIKKRNAALIGDDGTELLRRLDFLKDLPQSAFGYKQPAYDSRREIPRIEIITTVIGSHRTGSASPLCIYLEDDQCYVGYRNEEGIYSFNPDRTNFLAMVKRDKEQGLWIDKIVEQVMFASIKYRYSPPPEVAGFGLK